MPRCGATFGEKGVPLDEGDFRGCERKPTHPGAARHPLRRRGFQRRRTLSTEPGAGKLSNCSLRMPARSEGSLACTGRFNCDDQW